MGPFSTPISARGVGPLSPPISSRCAIALLAVFLVALILSHNIGVALWFPTFFSVVALVGHAEEKWGFFERVLILGVIPLSSLLFMAGIAMSLPGSGAKGLTICTSVASLWQLCLAALGWHYFTRKKP